MRNVRDEVEILFDRNVFSYILDELHKRPGVEEGGKYIGYIFKPGDSHLEKFQVNSRAQTIVITDFLPSGPRAVRTSVEFMPDGEYQEALFRRAEQLDPTIEHLGTWHSHHCNGLQTLSKGDVTGYLRTVNKAHYRPDYFISSLVKHIPNNPREDAWIDHFLFVRGIKNYYLATEHIRIIDWPTIFETQTGHSRTHRRTPAPSPVAEVAEISQEQSSAVWYETEEGRRILAEDKRFFDEQFGANVVATRRDAQIVLTGRVGYKVISVTYPRNPGDEKIVVSVKQNDSKILHIDCVLPYRRISFIAALAAAHAL
jgi:hypothetical protein